MFPERRRVGFIFKAPRCLFEYTWWGKIGGVSEPDNIHDSGEGVSSILWRLFTERFLPWNFYALTQVSDKIDLAKYCYFFQYQFFMQPNHNHLN